MKIFFYTLFLFLLTNLYSENLEEMIDKVKEGENKYDLASLTELTPKLKESISTATDQDNARYWFGRAILARCNIERFWRRELPDSKGKDITREGTASLAEQGIEVMTTVINNKPNWSDAYRIRGELHSHTITGFLTGMSNGPKALSDVNKAIELDADNAWAQYAQAKMYYYNPPISGGDVDKGIETCKKAENLGAGDRALTLMGRCYLKKERAKRAVIYFRKALILNPDNMEAKHFLDIALKNK